MDWITILVIAVLAAVVIFGTSRLRKIREENGGVVPEIKECDLGHSCSGCCGGTSCFNSKAKEPPLLVYFEDQELDRFRRRSGQDYTAEELAEWSEVLHTLSANELEPWKRSITLRRLPIPAQIQSELEKRLAAQA